MTIGDMFVLICQNVHTFPLKVDCIPWVFGDQMGLAD